MNDKCCHNFQSAVDKYLIRHRSVLDVLSKHQEAAARVNRAFVKAVTECGCVSISAERQKIPPDAQYSELREYMSSHISGELCQNCREVLAKELGHNMFYLAALCNLSGLELRDIIHQEMNNIITLGVFHLS